MLRICLAEMRGAWRTWLGVTIVFFTLSLVFVMSSLILASGWNAVSSGQMTLEDSSEFTLMPIVNFVLGGIVGIGVVSAAVSLVVDARRTALARLALGGATPAQVFTVVLSQLGLVTLACALVANVVSVVALHPYMRILAFAREEPGYSITAPDPVYSIPAILATNLVTVGYALAVGCFQAWRASRTEPALALREAVSGEQKRQILPLILAVLGALGAGLLTVAAFAAIPVLAEYRNKETATNVMQLALFVLLTTSLFCALLAPLYVGPLTRAWTALVPIRTGVWQVARRNVQRRSARLARSVVPVMFTLAMMLGMTVVMPTILETTRASGFEVQLSAGGTGAVVVLIGPVLAIAIAGGVGSLLMMSSQRDHELALTGLLGATPPQRLLLALLEGVIICVTALFPALLAVGVEAAYFQFGLPAADLVPVVVVPWGVFAGSFAVSLLIMVAATFLPTLPAHRLPENRVLAGVVSE